MARRRVGGLLRHIGRHDPRSRVGQRQPPQAWTCVARQLGEQQRGGAGKHVGRRAHGQLRHGSGWQHRLRRAAAGRHAEEVAHAAEHDAVVVTPASPQSGTFSASVTGAPPRTGVFFNVQRYWIRSDGPGGPGNEKNPIQAPFGEKNGSIAPSVPASGWASASSRRRTIKRRVRPSAPRPDVGQRGPRRARGRTRSRAPSETAGRG